MPRAAFSPPPPSPRIVPSVALLRERGWIESRVERSTASGLNRSIFERRFVLGVSFFKIAIFTPHRPFVFCLFFFSAASSVLCPLHPPGRERNAIMQYDKGWNSACRSIHRFVYKWTRRRGFRFFRFWDFSAPANEVSSGQRDGLCSEFARITFSFPRKSPPHQERAHVPGLMKLPSSPKNAKVHLDSPPPPENFKCPHRIMYYAVARLRIARKRDSVSSRGSALLLLLLFFAPWNIYFAPRRNESEILIGRRCSSSLCVIFREYFPLENFPKFFATYSLCVYFFGSLIFR